MESIGPTSTRILSPALPSSTGNGVNETALKASSPLRSLSGSGSPGLASKTTPVEGSSKSSVVVAVVAVVVALSEEGDDDDGNDDDDGDGELEGTERDGWFQTYAASGKRTAATNARSCVAWQAASKHMPAGEAETAVEEEEVEEVEGVKGVNNCINFDRVFLRLTGRPESSTALFKAAVISDYL